MVKQSRFKPKPKQKVSNKPSPKYRTRFTEPGPSKMEFGALTGFKVGIGQDQPSRVSFVSELLNRVRASRVPNLQHVKYPTRRLRPTAMGSRKLAMELWRKKETDFLRILPRLRGFHSPQSKPDQIMEVLRSESTKHSSVNSNNITKVILENNEIPLLHRRQYTRECIIRSWPSSQVMKNYGTNPMNPCIVRSFSPKASKEPGKTSDENKKDISKVEDPFDAPTYNIPEKPVTFTEGASYSLIILVGLGIAAAAGYAVFKELIFEPKEYKIFNKALKRIQDDAEVRVRIGYPITGYGQESRNRAARQRIPNRTWTDEDGIEHVEVNFYIRGPHGAGKVFAEMYKDQTDKQWKFTYLIAEIRSPSPAQLILESYLPSYAPA